MTKKYIAVQGTHQQSSEKRFDYEKAGMFERRGQVRRGEIPPPYQVLREIIRDVDPDLEGSEMARQSLMGQKSITDKVKR